MDPSRSSAASTADWGRFSDELRGWIARRMPGASSAEIDDLRQEILVRAIEKRDQLRDDEAIGGWLMTIARHRLADEKRRPRREVANEDMDRGAGELDLEGTEADAARAPARVLEAYLRSRLDTLPQKYATALRAVELEGMSQREAAEKLGLSYSTLRSHVQRGRDLLMADVTACCRVEVDGRNRVQAFEKRSSAAPCKCGPESC